MKVWKWGFLVLIVVLLSACVPPVPATPPQMVKLDPPKIDQSSAKKMYKNMVVNYLRDFENISGAFNLTSKLVRKLEADYKFIGAKAVNDGTRLSFLYHNNGYITNEWGMILSIFGKNATLRAAYLPDNNSYGLILTDSDLILATKLSKEPTAQNFTFEKDKRYAIVGFGGESSTYHGWAGDAALYWLDGDILGMPPLRLKRHDTRLYFTSLQKMRDFAEVLMAAFPHIRVDGSF